mgnify:CR=1 FL=1
MSEQTGGFQPDTVLDACGLHCPLPLLKAKQALATLAAGQMRVRGGIWHRLPIRVRIPWKAVNSVTMFMCTGFVKPGMVTHDPAYDFKKLG